MKRALMIAAFIVGLAIVPAYAQQSEHQHGQQDGMQQDRSGPHGHGGMTQDSEAMQQHLDEMQKMRGLMLRARAAQDPDERAQLLAQHRKMMEERMAAMMSGERAEMKERCHQQMTMMHNMMEQMADQMEQMMPPTGVEEHYWGSPPPD